MKYLLDQVGKPKVRALSAAPPVPALRPKLAFTESMYSGGTGPGRMSYRHPMAMPQQTGFQTQPFTTGGKFAGPPPGEEEGRAPKLSAMRAELELLLKSANVLSPQTRLGSSQRVGAPKMSAPGPSIAQIAKPVGWAKPLPGTTKGSL